MKNNKILNVVISLILLNMSVNATSQQQINNITHEFNNIEQQFENDNSNSSISDSESIKPHNDLFQPYKLISFGDGNYNIFVRDQLKINELYKNRSYTGILTTIDDFKQKYLNNEQNTQNKVHITKKKTQHYNNISKSVKKYLIEAEQCTCIMCSNGNKKTRVYNDQDIEKYNMFVLEVNDIVYDFNKISDSLVQNNNKLKLQIFKNGLQNIKTSRNKNNIIAKEFNKLIMFTQEIMNKVTILEKIERKSKAINNKDMIGKKRYREDAKKNSINKLETVLSNHDKTDEYLSS